MFLLQVPPRDLTRSTHGKNMKNAKCETQDLTTKYQYVHGSRMTFVFDTSTWRSSTIQALTPSATCSNFERDLLCAFFVVKRQSQQSRLCHEHQCQACMVSPFEYLPIYSRSPSLYSIDLYSRIPTARPIPSHAVQNTPPQLVSTPQPVTSMVGCCQV